jgi:hypothetical protein
MVLGVSNAPSREFVRKAVGGEAARIMSTLNATVKEKPRSGLRLAMISERLERNFNAENAKIAESIPSFQRQRSRPSETP